MSWNGYDDYDSEEHYEKCPKCGAFALHLAKSLDLFMYGDTYDKNDNSDEHPLSDEEITLTPDELQAMVMVCFTCKHVQYAWFEEPRTQITPKSLAAAGVPYRQDPQTKRFIYFLCDKHTDQLMWLDEPEALFQEAILIVFDGKDAPEKMSENGLFYSDGDIGQFRHDHRHYLKGVTTIEQLTDVYFAFFAKPYTPPRPEGNSDNPSQSKSYSEEQKLLIEKALDTYVSSFNMLKGEE